MGFYLQVKDVSRANCKGVVAASLDEVKAKSAEKFGKVDVPNIHLDSDGTEIDDEDYFQTLEPNTELVAVFEGEQWIDVSTKWVSESIFATLNLQNLAPFRLILWWVKWREFMEIIRLSSKKERETKRNATLNKKTLSKLKALIISIYSRTEED